MNFDPALEPSGILLIGLSMCRHGEERQESGEFKKNVRGDTYFTRG